MEDWSKKEPRFCYMLLDRLRQDCEYYLRIGGSANCLWADSVKDSDGKRTSRPSELYRKRNGLQYG